MQHNTQIADGNHNATVTLKERRKAAPYAEAFSVIFIDTLTTQEKIANDMGLTQPHVATLMVRIDEPEPAKKPGQEDRPRVTSVGSKLRVLTDITVMHFLDDAAVASLRQNVALVEDDSAADNVKREIDYRIGEINFRIANTTHLVSSSSDAATRNRAGKELVLLRWVEATLARRRSSWPGADKRKLAEKAKEAFAACAEEFRRPETNSLFTDDMRLAFSAVVSINQASAEWDVRKANGENLFEKAFLEEQLKAYNAAFSVLTKLNPKQFRPTRALALRACLEMALYLQSPEEPRYLALFKTHLIEARRAKTAVQWYLDNFIDSIEEPFKTSISCRPGWDALRNI